MPRTRGSKTYTKYRVRTLPAALSDDKLQSILKEQASQRYELEQMVVVVGLGLRLVFAKRGNN